MTRTSFTQKAATCFIQGDYKNALELYKKAGDIIGKENVKNNILICEVRLNKNTFPQKRIPLTNNKSDDIVKENIKLKKEIEELKKTVKLKELNIQERFQELAILTKLLEEK